MEGGNGGSTKIRVGRGIAQISENLRRQLDLRTEGEKRMTIVSKDPAQEEQERKKKRRNHGTKTEVAHMVAHYRSGRCDSMLVVSWLRGQWKINDGKCRRIVHRQQNELDWAPNSADGR